MESEAGGQRPMLYKLETIRAVPWGYAPDCAERLCLSGQSRPSFSLIRAAGRRSLPAARMMFIYRFLNGKAQPFRTASGEAAGHLSIGGSNLDKLGHRPPLQQSEWRPRCAS